MPTSLDQFTVYVTPKVHARLKTLADSEGRTLSNFVVQSLHRLVMPDLKPALQRSKPLTVRKSKARTRSK